MSDIPNTTLFMLMSADGKISTGKSDDRDFDKDLPSFYGVGDGLGQYYQLEQETDLFSFNTGKVMAKVGWNDEKQDIDKSPVTFIIVDNKPHLTQLGVSNLLKKSKKLIIVTNNFNHPAYADNNPNLEVIKYESVIDFVDLFKKLKQMGMDSITIQSGGEMNALLVREGLISNVSLVIAPLFIGGRETPTLIDGDSLSTLDDLKLLRPLEIKSADILNDSYLHLKYKVINT